MAYFTLARKVDPTYKTNLIILTLTLSLLLARGIYTGDWGSALAFSGGFFLTWALVREIDPLHAPSAFVAAAVYLLLGIWRHQLSLGAVLWTILLLRGITETTGKKITVVDLLVLTGLAVYLIFSQENGVYGLIFTAAMVIGYLRYGKNTLFRLFIGFGFIISIWGSVSYSILITGASVEINGFRPFLLVVGLAAGIFYGGKLLKDRGIRNDQGELLDTKYVFWSYLFYLGMYIVYLLGTNLEEGTLRLFFAVIIGAALYRIWILIQHQLIQQLGG